MKVRTLLVQIVGFAAAGSTPLSLAAQSPAQAPVVQIHQALGETYGSGGIVSDVLQSVAKTAPRRANFRPTRFSVEVRGRGRDVILIPGLTAGRHIWNGAVSAVPGYRYHLIQVGGFAGQPAGGNANGPVVHPLAEEIARYIEAQGLVRPAIVGHSMGGTLAMILATKYPARVGRVMVVDMLPRPTSLFGGSAAAQLAQGLGGLMSDPGGRQLLSGLVSAFSPPEDVDARNSNPDVVARALHDLGTIDMTAELARLRVPLTVLYAARDQEGRAIADQTFAQAYRGARGARLVRVDNSGHVIMANQPRRFARELQEFLR